jgi:hypothetical protein
MNKALELAERICHGLDWYEFDYQTWCVDASRELRRLAAVEEAARNLAKVKGRYHTEQAYKALQDALGETK